MTWLRILANSIMIMILQYISINMVYILNLHYVICQIDLSKVGKNIFFCLGMIITPFCRARARAHTHTHTHTHTTVHVHVHAKNQYRKYIRPSWICVFETNKKFLMNHSIKWFKISYKRFLLHVYLLKSLSTIFWVKLIFPLCANKFSLLFQILYISSRYGVLCVSFTFLLSIFLIYRPLPNPAFLLFRKMTF